MYKTENTLIILTLKYFEMYITLQAVHINVSFHPNGLLSIPKYHFLLFFVLLSSPATHHLLYRPCWHFQALGSRAVCLFTITGKYPKHSITMQWFSKFI